MKVVVSFEFDERVRRAIRARVGRDGLADRADCRALIGSAVTALVEDLVSELDAAELEGARRELELVVGRPVELDGDGDPPPSSERRPSRRPTKA